MFKRYICCLDLQVPHHLSTLPQSLFSSFLPEVEKRGRKSHLHQAKLCWAALSVEKTWGFDSSHSMVINYFSTVVGLLSSPLSAVVVEVEVLPGGWRQHMISAALITGLTGKRPRQAAGQHEPITALRGPSGPAFVYSLSGAIEKKRCSSAKLCV